MFKQLTAFGVKRSAAQALGFYLAYLLLGGLGSGLIAILFGMAGLIEGYSAGVSVGAWVAVPFSLGIGLVVALKKGRVSQFAVILSLPVTGVLASFGGSFLGLLIPAYLTTLKSADEEAQVKHD